MSSIWLQLSHVLALTRSPCVIGVDAYNFGLL